MKQITERNNIFYLNGFDEVPEWVTESSDGKKYFPLNKITREFFKKDFLPKCLSGEISLTTRERYLIRDFTQNQYHKAISTNIPPGITLMQHQEKALDIVAMYNRFAFFFGTGTGKTIIAICAILTYCPENILIVTPKSVIPQYENELKKYNVDNATVTNFESLNKIVKSGTRFDMVIVDEAHKAKNFMSNANIALRNIASTAQNVYLFTGTPQDKSRHEILPQIAILDQRVMPVKGKIYERYFHINDYFEPDREISKFSDELTAVIKSYSYGIQSDEAIDLPPENNIKVMCPHPDKYYDELNENRVLKFPQGEVVCTQKSMLRLKLREICAGHLNVERTVLKTPGTLTTPPEYEVIKETIRVPNKKIAKLLWSIRQANGHGIIYTEFQEDIKIIIDVIMRYTEYTYATLGKKKKDTEAAVNGFKDGLIDFLILNSKSGGTGLDLSCTHSIIFYSLPESYIFFSQCKARIRRYGQLAETCDYYFLLSEGTVEEQQYSALLKKKNFDNKTFKVYKRR